MFQQILHTNSLKFRWLIMKPIVVSVTIGKSKDVTIDQLILHLDTIPLFCGMQLHSLILILMSITLLKPPFDQDIIDFSL